jgi:predicted XRE-type DNA-binding protein
MLAERDAQESAAPIADCNSRLAPPTVTANHRVRMLLMARLQQLMVSRRLTQVQAAAWFHVSQSRISHLVNNQANRFTTDTLINMLAHAGLEAQVTFRRVGV